MRRPIGFGVRLAWSAFWLAVIVAGNLWHGAITTGWLLWGTGIGILLLAVWWRRQDGSAADHDERLRRLSRESAATAFLVVMGLLILEVAGSGFGLSREAALAIPLLGGGALWLGTYAWRRSHG